MSVRVYRATAEWSFIGEDLDSRRCILRHVARDLRARGWEPEEFVTRRLAEGARVVLAYAWLKERVSGVPDRREETLYVAAETLISIPVLHPLQLEAIRASGRRITERELRSREER